jgi:hypothetical protein
MDFPTALRYLMAGRTIRRESDRTQYYRLGTIHEIVPARHRWNRDDGPAVLWIWEHARKVNPCPACISSSELLAEDWELVE